MATELPYIPCCTDNCLDDLKQLIGVNCFETILDQGFIEYSTIQGRGLACKVLEIAEKYNISPSQVFEIINVILDRGIVVHCDPNGQISIASIEEWLKYAEALGYTQTAAVPA